MPKSNVLVVKRAENRYVRGEFWTSKQRQAHPIHYSVSYRAAFKPELPAFFIKHFLSKTQKTVLDPFGGRGTTAIQANLDGHFAVHNDINPLSIFLAKSRQIIPEFNKLEKKLDSLILDRKLPELENEEDLLPFFHKKTLSEIRNLMQICREDKTPEMEFIRLIALSRLHGHSTGFFSVYTFPQISIPSDAQRKNNKKRNQKPDYRPIKPRIQAKMSKDILKSPLPPFYHEFSRNNIYTNLSADNMYEVNSSSIDLIITSPPFLDKVNYGADNWLKLWFLEIPQKKADSISIFHGVESWADFIGKVLKECSRVMKRRAVLIMEVGDVQVGKKTVNLDEAVIHSSKFSSLSWAKTYVNTQKFTKLSNCWNVSNNEKGTNSNRCVVFEKL